MEKFNGKYRIPSNRLNGFDYASNGMYFVKFCTKNRIHYFGEINEQIDKPQNPSIDFTEIGKIANQYWQAIPEHFPFVELDEYTIMPDHIHGILIFNNPEKTTWEPNKFGPQSKNLGSVLRGFKSTVKRYANINNIKFCWQSNYHDRIIRNYDELERIRKYIRMNPTNWLKRK